ncbi:MAG: metallophosphoesterase family protein [Planctomycetota bacterium]
MPAPRTRTTAVYLSLLFMVTGLGAVASAQSVAAVTEAALHAPSAMPDRVVLTWTGDPTTSQAVTWRTSTDVSVAMAEIAVSEGGPSFVDAARRVRATTRPFMTDINDQHVHSVTFAGLTPGTVYVYRVGDGTNWTEWFQFRTAAADPEPWSFVYFGDAQNSVRSMWSRVLREAVRDMPRASFMLHAGDLVDDRTEDAEWGEWFNAGGWVNASIPVIATPGNHEYSRTRSGRVLTPHWEHVFAFPENGPSGLETTVFYTDYQNARIISLNSLERPEDQVAWVEGVLGSNEQTWTILTFHYPIYSMARERDNPELRSMWKPIFDRHGVDLVLTGHDHTYGRQAMKADAENTPSGMERTVAETGTVYVVSVSGPKMYNLTEERRISTQRVAEDTQLYQLIRVDGDELSYEARMADGTPYDAFVLRKGADGGRNVISERIPAVLERRRGNE